MVVRDGENYGRNPRIYLYFKSTERGERREEDRMRRSGGWKWRERLAVRPPV
jgi:hypothetical protein